MLAIMNLIQTKLHRINGRIVDNACVKILVQIVINAYEKYWKKIFIGVEDMHPDGQNFQIFCQFEQTKLAISRSF